MSLAPPAPDSSDTGPDAAPPRSRARRALRWVYVVGLVGAAGAVLVVRRDEVGDLVAGARPGPILAALALGMLSLVQSAVFWSRCLASLGSPRPVREVLEATVAAIPARYLPGSVWYAAGRVGHLRRSGTSTVSLTVVATLETLLSFVVALALGGGLLLASGGEGGDIDLVALAGAAVLLAAVASPWAVNPLLRLIARRGSLETVPALRWRTYLELGAHLVAFWVASAAAFVSYLAAFPAIDAPGVVETAGTFLVAWAAGFVAVFAPQGAGVFETTLAGLLSSAPVAALAVVIGGYRALTAVRDAVALGALAAARSLRR